MAFSLPADCFVRVGDLESFLLPTGFDIAEADLEYGSDMLAESCDCRRLLIGIRELGESWRDTLRVPELGGVGYRGGMFRELRFGMLGTGCGFSTSISLRLRLWCSIGFAGGDKVGQAIS